MITEESTAPITDEGLARVTAEGLVRLDAALAWIDAHPEQHDQSVWMARSSCGTTYCLAGAVVMLAGAEPLWDLDAGTESYRVKMPDGAVHSVEVLAAELLGIQLRHAGLLFHDCDDRESLGEVRDQFAASLPSIQEPIHRGEIDQ